MRGGAWPGSQSSCHRPTRSSCRNSTAEPCFMPYRRMAARDVLGCPITLKFSRRVAIRWNDPLCSQFNKFSLTGGRGYWLTAFDQSLNVKLHRFMDEPSNFGTGFTHSYATGQIRYIGTKTCRAFFNNHKILHCRTSFFQKCLLKNAVQRPRRHINAGLSRYRHCARFGRMTKLPMAALLAHQLPTVSLDHHQSSFTLTGMAGSSHSRS